MKIQGKKIQKFDHLIKKSSGGQNRVRGIGKSIIVATKIKFKKSSEKEREYSRVNT